VQEHIKYKYDMSSFGKSEHFQFSFETLTRRFGDCEDSALLTIDLATKLGVPKNKLFLGLGHYKSFGHAFPILNTEAGYLVGEPTLSEGTMPVPWTSAPDYQADWGLVSPAWKSGLEFKDKEVAGRGRATTDPTATTTFVRKYKALEEAWNER
jgi:transglutaminase-like putative cysteine protease